MSTYITSHILCSWEIQLENTVTNTVENYNCKYSWKNPAKIYSGILRYIIASLSQQVITSHLSYILHASWASWTTQPQCSFEMKKLVITSKRSPIIQHNMYKLKKMKYISNARKHIKFILRTHPVFPYCTYAMYNVIIWIRPSLKIQRI